LAVLAAAESIQLHCAYFRLQLRRDTVAADAK
jgi:hypothetical protein